MTDSIDVFNFYHLTTLEQLEYVKEEPEAVLGILWYLEGYNRGIR